MPRVLASASQPIPAYSLLFVFAVVFHTYLGTGLAVPHGSMVRPVIFAGLIVLIIGLVLAPVLGWFRAVLATMVIPLLMIELHPAPHAQVVLIALPLIVGLAIELVSRWRRRDAWAGITKYLNSVAVVFLGLAVVTWISAGGVQQLAREWRLDPPAVNATTTAAPSIYVILLDGYPRADTLRDHLDHESALVVGLEELRFDHYTDSRSNYPNTTLTTATLFNMAHLDDLGLIRGNTVPAPRQPQFRNALTDPAAFRVAREHGYEVVVVESGWDELTPTGAHRTVHTGGLTQLEEAMLRYSAVGPIVDLLHPHLFGDTRRGRIEQALEETVQLTESRGQRLVWTHVPAPHFPLVYAADGAPLLVPPEKLGGFDVEDPRLLDRYRANLEHVDRLVLAAVNRIVSAHPEAVVVIMSDHGSLLELGGPEERVANLTLGRTPGHPRLLGDGATPIELFPRLFNAYLETTIDVPDRRSYRSLTGDGTGDWVLIEVP